MTEEKFVHFVGAKVTDAQLVKIEESGLSQSEYIRNAIDFYDVGRLQSYSHLHSNWIGQLITLLNVWDEKVKSTPENTFNELVKNVKFVKPNRGSLLNNPPKSLNDSERIVKPEKKVKPETLNKSDKIVKQSEDDAKQEAQAEAWEQVKLTLRNMTTAKGRPSHEDFRRQAKKCGKSKGELERYYQKHLPYFQQDCVSTIKK